MSDAKTVVEAAVFEALEASIAGATVYQDVPENAPLPLVIVGDLSSKRLLGKDSSRDRIVTVSIVSLVEAEQRAPLLALQGQIDDVLDGARFTPDGWTLAGAFEDDEAALQEDGQTYGGVSTFTFLALAD